MSGQYNINDMAAASREAVAAQRAFEAKVAAQTQYRPLDGAMLGRMSADCAAIPERSLPAIKDRVHQLTDRAGEIASRLESIGDRLFGGRPIGNGAGGETLACSGEVASINDALDALSAQIARAHDAMTRLEAL